MQALNNSGETLEVAGYASLFDIEDQGGDLVRAGAFAEGLKARGPTGVRMLFQHDAAEPVGVWDEIAEDGRGLYVRGRILSTAPRGRAALGWCARGRWTACPSGFARNAPPPDRAGGAICFSSICGRCPSSPFPCWPRRGFASLGLLRRGSPRRRPDRFDYAS
jgi:HK97 family phage prohead protease